MCVPHLSEMPHHPDSISASQELLLGREWNSFPLASITNYVFLWCRVESSQDLLSHLLPSGPGRGQKHVHPASLSSSLHLIFSPLPAMGPTLICLLCVFLHSSHPHHCTFISNSLTLKRISELPSQPALCHERWWAQRVSGQVKRTRAW